MAEKGANIDNTEARQRAALDAAQRGYQELAAMTPTDEQKALFESFKNNNADIVAELQKRGTTWVDGNSLKSLNQEISARKERIEGVKTKMGMNIKVPELPAENFEDVFEASRLKGDAVPAHADRESPQTIPEISLPEINRDNAVDELDKILAGFGFDKKSDQRKMAAESMKAVIDEIMGGQSIPKESMQEAFKRIVTKAREKALKVQAIRQARAA